MQISKQICLLYNCLLFLMLIMRWTKNKSVLQLIWDQELYGKGIDL